MITPTTLRSSTRALLVASSRARTFTRLPALRVQRQSTMASDQQIIFTKDAPAALGPYSQAIKTPSTIYCSGQIPLKPDGTFVEGSIAEKTEQCCKNVKAVVEAAGSSMGKVVKTTVFLSDMAHFGVGLPEPCEEILRLTKIHRRSMASMRSGSRTSPPAAALPSRPFPRTLTLRLRLSHCLKHQKQI